MTRAEARERDHEMLGGEYFRCARCGRRDYADGSIECSHCGWSPHPALCACGDEPTGHCDRCRKHLCDGHTHRCARCGRAWCESCSVSFAEVQQVGKGQVCVFARRENK